MVDTRPLLSQTRCDAVLIVAWMCESFQITVVTRTETAGILSGRKLGSRRRILPRLQCRLRIGLGGLRDCTNLSCGRPFVNGSTVIRSVTTVRLQSVTVGPFTRSDT